MDRAITSNQNQMGLLQLMQGTGQKIKFFDMTKFMERLLPKVGIKDVDSFYFDVTAPPMPTPAGGMGTAGAQGAIAPQIGGRPTPEAANMVQAGGQGGI